MFSKEQVARSDKAGSQRPAPEVATRSSDAPAHQLHPTTIFQRTMFNPRGLAPRDVLRLQRAVGNQAVRRMLSQSLVQRQIEFEYDEEGNELEVNKSLTAKEAFNLLVVVYGLPRTNRLKRKLLEFEEKNAIFSDAAELIKVLGEIHNVPTLSVADQAAPVFKARAVDKTSNFANAHVVIDVPTAPVFDIAVSGSKRVGNSIYVFPPTQKKGLKADIEASQHDSEIGLLQNLHERLLEDKGLLAKLKQHKPRVYIRIVSNMGPCDACKQRIAFFKEVFAKTAGYNGLVIDIHYSSPPGKAKNRASSTFGWEGDPVWKSGLNKGGMYVHKL